MKVIIIGGGQVGYYPTSLLIERGHKVMIIETRNNRIKVLKGSPPHNTILQDNGAGPKMLETTDIRQVDVIAAVTGSDENSLVVDTLARLEYGMHRVIGRVNNPKNAWLFTPLMGVDTAVSQADLMVRLVTEEISMDDMTALLKLHDGKCSLVERVVSPGFFVQDKLLRDIELSIECILVTVIHSSDLLIPHGETMLQGGDKVVTIIHIDQLENMEKILSAGM